MSQLKPIARRLVALVGRCVGAAQIWWIGRRIGDRPVLVLDIDNTLADAWPSFLQASASERERLAGLRALPGMKAATVGGRAGSGDGEPVVVFVSHRALWHWGTTRSWLRNMGYEVSIESLVLVSDPAEKIGHLRRLVGPAGRGGRSSGAPGALTYWDDLSHGTEHGETKLYDHVVREVHKLAESSGRRLTYHGLDDIEAVVAAAGGRTDGSSGTND